ARGSRHASWSANHHALPEPPPLWAELARRESARLPGAGLCRIVGRVGQSRRHANRGPCMKTLFILIQHLVPQHLLSRLAGMLAACEVRWLKNLWIENFIAIYGVDMSQA